jgi:hypothetical protein
MRALETFAGKGPAGAGGAIDQIIGTFGPLSLIEEHDLTGLEHRVKKGLETFIDTAEALLEIRDRKLYRAKYCSFEQYCRERWNMTARRARQICAASDVVHELQGNNCSTLPATESQARPLTTLPKEQRAEAWQEAVAAAPAGAVTAKHVQEAVDRRKPKAEDAGQGQVNKWPKPDWTGKYDRSLPEEIVWQHRDAQAKILVLQVGKNLWAHGSYWQIMVGRPLKSGGELMREGFDAESREQAIHSAAVKLDEEVRERMRIDIVSSKQQMKIAEKICAWTREVIDRQQLSPPKPADPREANAKAVAERWAKAKVFYPNKDGNGRSTARQKAQEEEISASLGRARDAARELEEKIGTATSVIKGSLAKMLRCLDGIEDELEREGRLHKSRQEGWR